MPQTQFDPQVVEQPSLHEFCREVCLGNSDAMDFCNSWFIYCHAIDDLIDDNERPKPERLLEVFIQANVLFSCAFYVAFHVSLQPIVLLITNAYADSVAWEASPEPHRRAIADVIRCCGNDMFFAVAMICGGWKHARSLSPRIRERSWILQHE
jgi:hypothetical protein